MTAAVPVLTVDGPSGSGKGTVSRLLAQRLGWHLLDSGALYRLVALAVTSPKRSPIAPEVPTLVELGVRGVEAPSWYSIVAPSATPKEAVARLHAEIVAIAARPDYREPLERQALEPTTTTPEQFAVFLRAEYDKWGKVIKALKLN